MQDETTLSPEALKRDLEAFNDRHFHRGAIRRLEGDDLPELKTQPQPPAGEPCHACGGPAENEAGRDGYGGFLLVSCTDAACGRRHVYRDSVLERREQESLRRLYAAEKRKHDRAFPTFAEWTAGRVARGNGEGQNHD
ncbi:hypothetical protein [Paludisphaera rhizosphaerae]|uniref:hypothetical protein n=1 Tax=Paludisphaera rhizosphaerae TaxID=2711216 RepID=UPI0013EDC859|nr:hypothetical protein [Paludisphaera rhizosphaerae]